MNRRSWSLAAVALALATATAACGGASAEPTGALVEATPQPSGIAPAASAEAPAVTVAPTPGPTPTAEATPVEFDSAAYGYRAVFPAGEISGSPTPAAQPWDGEAVINSDGPYGDRFARPGSRLLFVYGAPTALDLAAYAEDGQRKKNDWHGCPATPERSVETTFGGTPALLYSFECGGLRVFSLYVVHDGMGVVFNQLTPPGSEAADEADFAELLAGWSWLD